MARIRIATFNVENLFARYRFKSNVDVEKAVKDGWKADARYFTIYDEKSKRITAETIKALKGHVVCLQEVENLDTLKRFRNRYLGGRKAYPHAVAIDGNDPRLIDVAVLSKYPVTNIRTHQHLWVPSWRYYLFSRDCLELDVVLRNGKTLTLYVEPLQVDVRQEGSLQRPKKDAREATEAGRQGEGDCDRPVGCGNAGDKPFVILGDLNDYPETDSQGATGIDQLLAWDQVENVVDRLPQGDRWTHFFKGNKKCEIPKVYRQLDYLLVSRSLADGSSGMPKIERRGMPKRAKRYQGPWFPGVSKNKPKASDHAPVYMDIELL